MFFTIFASLLSIISLLISNNYHPSLVNTFLPKKVSNGFVYNGKTANDYVMPYTEYFLYGSNMGYYPGFKDEEIADLCINAGVKSLRLSLPAFFLEKHGYDFKIKTFEHYKAIGAKDNTVFLGYPANWQMDSIMYCTTKEKPTKIFKNLYEPVFIKDKDTVKVNPENFYAEYIFKTVSLYKPYVKFWELWNEPDFDETGAFGWKHKGQKGNWWDADPDPCILKNIHAPVQYYIRMLRVAYQVIKFVDSTAYVCTGGIGYESFLDAVLRNTDNPDGGKVAEDFPLKGGAYFDCLSIHIYPQYEQIIKHYDVKQKKMIYNRNSDAAGSSFSIKKAIFDTVLANYGYEGKTFPKKVFLMTEYNISRGSFKDFIGGEEVQKNFIPKALIDIQKAGFAQAYIYCLMDLKSQDEAKGPFDMMGLYRNSRQNINSILGSPASMDKFLNPEGLAFKTTSHFLYESRLDTAITNNKTDSVKIFVFRKSDGNISYILWGISINDNDENVSIDYNVNFLGLKGYGINYWDYALNKTAATPIQKNITLTSTPLFLFKDYK